MKVSKSKATELLSSLGYKGQKVLTQQRLESRINRLLEVIDEDTDVDNEELNSLLKSVIKELKDGGKVIITMEEGDEPDESQQDTEIKAGGKKVKKEKKKDESKVRPIKGRPYYAGQVIKDFEEGKITPEMIQEVNTRVGKPNDTESEAWLRLATHIIRGFTSNGEGEETREEVEEEAEV